MSTFDPYAAPATPVVGRAPSVDVPQGAVEALRGTRPWVRLFAILGFVVATLMVVGGLVAALGGGASLFGDMAGGGAAIIGMGLAYLLIGLLYFMPCLYLFRYASRITRLTAGGGGAALVDALDQQRRFWRLVGIYSVVMLALYAVLLVGMLIFAAISAAGFGG